MVSILPLQKLNTEAALRCYIRKPPDLRRVRQGGTLDGLTDACHTLYSKSESHDFFCQLVLYKQVRDVLAIEYLIKVAAHHKFLSAFVKFLANAKQFLFSKYSRFSQPSRTTYVG